MKHHSTENGGGNPDEPTCQLFYIMSNAEKTDAMQLASQKLASLPSYQKFPDAKVVEDCGCFANGHPAPQSTSCKFFPESLKYALDKAKESKEFETFKYIAASFLVSSETTANKDQETPQDPPSHPIRRP